MSHPRVEYGGTVRRSRRREVRTTPAACRRGGRTSARVVCALAGGLATLLGGCVGVSPGSLKDPGWAGSAPASLDALLEPVRARYGLPALGAAVVRDGVLVAAGAVGTRRAGAEIPVTLNDRFHLGSDTKAFTALLAGQFVEQGKLRWDTTLGEVFPELLEAMAPGVSGVTLERLLSHTSGFPADNERFGELLGESLLAEGNLDDIRYGLVARWVREPLAHEPGRVFAYSNMGYILAGAMLERISGKTWEELVTERIFVPLGLNSAGFGPQATVGRVDAPLGHAIRADGSLKPMLAGPNGDNPLLLGPAGTVHMSLLDFAVWAAWNAGQGRRAPALVRPDTLKKLHAPVISMPAKPDAPPGTPSHGRYGLGWGEINYDWAGGPLLYHGGSNERNLAHILVQPARDFGMVIVANIGGPKADEAFRALEEALYRRYGNRVPAPAGP